MNAGYTANPALAPAANAHVHALPPTTTFDAVRFYQRRGFCLVRAHHGAVDRSRAGLKLEIPPMGAYGIPLRDEIEPERQP